MNWLDRKIEEFIKSVRYNPKIKKIPIGLDVEDPTYWRWFVWRRNRFLNCYLHNFRHDDAQHLHDHRMINISFILQGRYFEERFLWKPRAGGVLPPTYKTLKPTYSLIFRLPSTPHRVVLDRDRVDLTRELPSWSLFIGLPHWRDWGFWKPQASGAIQWVPWQQYTQGSDPTAIGYGQAKKE